MLTIVDTKINDYGESARRTRAAPIRFRFVPIVNDATGHTMRSVVDDARFACGRTRGAVARIPQITSLDPCKLRRRPEIVPRSGAPDQRVSACCVRINHPGINFFKGKVETACPCSKASSIPRTIRL